MVIELREWSRMTEQLRRYYPQTLRFDPDLGTDWFLDEWELVPTPERAVEVPPEAIGRVLSTWLRGPKRRRSPMWSYSWSGFAW